MEVILREDVAGLGIIGDVVKVKPGYARNFLLPRGLAVTADRRNLGQLEHQKRVIAAKKARERGDIERRADTIKGLAIEIELRAGKGGKLFGSVTNIDVKRLLDEKGFDVDRRHIELREPIKEIGEYEVLVRVGQDIAAPIKLVVKPLGGQLEAKSVDGHDEVEVVEEVAADTEAEPAAEEEEAADE
jgi:large subunit ribosomal protein L9